VKFHKQRRRCFISACALFFLCIATIATSAAKPGRQSEQTVEDSSATLRTLISGILDAIQTKDNRRADQIIGGLVMENDSRWFTAQFDARTAELVRAAYQQSMKDFVSTTRELYAADLRRGSINIRVNRYDNPTRAPQPISELLQSMNSLEPLYEVSLSGERPTFQIALPGNGGRGRVVAGDLDGYFIEERGFHFVPSDVLKLAAQERQKNQFEVLSRDAGGRPTRVRIGGGALSSLVIERAAPEYPQSARQKKVEGEVVVSAIIGINGRPQEVTVLSGPPELHNAAINTMKKWRFKPFQIDGRPVEVQAQFAFNYASR